MYYNTTKLSGEDLKEAVSKASKQDDRVLAIAKCYAHKELTPRRIWWYYIKHYGNKPMITSIRRSVDTLKDAGLMGEGERIKHTCPVDQFETTERKVYAINKL